MRRSTMSALLSTMFLFSQGRWSDAICEGGEGDISCANILLNNIKGVFKKEAPLNKLALAGFNVLAKRTPGSANRADALKLESTLWDLLGEVWQGYFKRTMTSGEQSLLRAIELSATGDNPRMGAQLAQLDLRGTASKDVVKLVMAMSIEPGRVPGQDKTMALAAKRFGTKKIYPVLLTGLTSLCIAANVSAELIPLAKKLHIDKKTAGLLCGLIALTKQENPSGELAQRLGVSETLLKTMVRVSKGNSISGENEYMANFLLNAVYPKEANTGKLTPKQCIDIFESFCGRIGSLVGRLDNKCIEGTPILAAQWKTLDALLTIVAPHGPPLRLDRHRAATALAAKLVEVASAATEATDRVQTQKTGVTLLLQAGRKTGKYSQTIGEEAIMSITEQFLDCADSKLVDDFPRALRVLLDAGRELHGLDHVGKGLVDKHYESSSADTDIYDHRIRLGDMMKEAFDYISSANEPLPSASDNTESRGAKTRGDPMSLEIEIARMFSFNSRISKASIEDLATFVDSIKRLTRLICRVFSLEPLAAALFPKSPDAADGDYQYEDDQCSLLVGHLLLLSKGTVHFGSCTRKTSPVLDALLDNDPTTQAPLQYDDNFKLELLQRPRCEDACKHSKKDIFHNVARYLVGAVSGNMVLLRDHEEIGAKHLLNAFKQKMPGTKELEIDIKVMRKLVLLRHGTWAFTRHWRPSLHRDKDDVSDYENLLKELAESRWKER
ncbi:hypothetical protein N9U05_00005 [bacterium]|nr:hypothetical protein [bacterium]